MAGSSIGKLFKITTWGESHGKALGVVVDGCPAGVELSEEDLQVMLDRRKPGQAKYATKRNESDAVQILSGVFEGRTTGTPISLLVFNEDQKSRDYSKIKDVYRPGHADYGFDKKFGFRDYRGGGRSSGRETLGRVAVGAIAKKILKKLGISINAYTESINNIFIDKENFSIEDSQNNELVMPDKKAYEKAALLLDECMKNEDSVGGTIVCNVKNLKAGVGSPVFDKLDALLGKALFSIGTVKAVEIGSGVLVSKMYGSENNDDFYVDDGVVKKGTNHSGGILGGISDGSNIFVRATIKPTPSIFKEQKTVNNSNQNVNIKIKGRHDPVVVPRAVVVVESMVCITILDSLMESMLSKMDSIKLLYNEF